MDTITTIQSLIKSNGSAQPVMVALTPNKCRLIAAAPDLLALAEATAAHFIDTDAPLGNQARAAIAKATE